MFETNPLTSKKRLQAEKLSTSGKTILGWGTKLLVLLSAFTLGTVPARAGGTGTSTDPYTTLASALNNTTAGFKYFNVNGTQFNTWVKPGGEMLIIRDRGNGVGTLPQVTDMQAISTTRGALTSSILAMLDNLEYIRIMSTDPVVPANDLNATTIDWRVMDRLQSGQALHTGKADKLMNSTWTGTNQAYVRSAAATCGAIDTIYNKVIHGCGDTSATTWVPSGNYQRALYSAGEISNNATIEIWAKPYASPAVNTLLVEKTADKTLQVPKDDLVTYTYVVTNTSATEPMYNVTLSDNHQGYGSFTGPNIESATLTYDNPAYPGDSSNTDTGNGTWDILGPGDKITVTATYTVTQADLEYLQ